MKKINYSIVFIGDETKEFDLKKFSIATKSEKKFLFLEEDKNTLVMSTNLAENLDTILIKRDGKNIFSIIKDKILE